MRIIILGSGNIATHLGKALAQSGQHEILQVYSRLLANAKALANVLSSKGISEIQELREDADLYLLAVSDDAIALLADQLPKSLNGTVVHCSGATPMHILKRFSNYGVVYPVQSFSKTVDLQLDDVPIGIESNKVDKQEELIKLFRNISNRVFFCSTDQRMAIHVSAVFANNFSNALFGIAKSLLDEHNLSFDLIRPIIMETAEKVQKSFPDQVQTGPAIRNDRNTIERHLQFISSNPDWQLIYQKISELITKRGQNKS